MTTFLIELIKILVTGIIVGMILKFLNLPSLAPGTFLAIIGILGLFIGYAIV